jgi:protease-4
MWNAIRKVSKKKPVVVTMGSVAASGGYYISSAGTKVLASKTTLTGSIGVLNGKFVTTGLFNKLGVNLYSVKIGKYALSFSSYEELGPEGEEIMNREIQWAYQKFLKRIQEGRGLDPDSVDKIGRGRIWSGRDAKRIGIVDENGGILEAIKLSKDLIKCKNVKVTYYPTRKPSLPFANLMPQATVLDMLLEGPSYIEFTKPLIVR